jgi:hypothetical protein
MTSHEHLGHALRRATSTQPAPDLLPSNVMHAIRTEASKTHLTQRTTRGVFVVGLALFTVGIVISLSGVTWPKQTIELPRLVEVVAKVSTVSPESMLFIVAAVSLLSLLAYSLEGKTR